jgi:hypothetical protein
MLEHPGVSPVMHAYVTIITYSGAERFIGGGPVRDILVMLM